MAVHIRKGFPFVPSGHVHLSLGKTEDELQDAPGPQGPALHGSSLLQPVSGFPKKPLGQEQLPPLQSAPLPQGLGLQGSG